METPRSSLFGCYISRADPHNYLSGGTVRILIGIMAAPGFVRV